jgi:hypothetical protein
MNERLKEVTLRAIADIIKEDKYKPEITYGTPQQIKALKEMYSKHPDHFHVDFKYVSLLHE